MMKMRKKSKEDSRKIKVVGHTTPSKHGSSTILSSEGLSPCLTATDFKHPKRIIEGGADLLRLRESTSKGYREAKTGDGVEIGRLGCTTRRGVCHEDESGTLNTGGGWGTVTNDYRIRKLTPVECERLQAFPDGWTEFGKDGERISDTQRYKCCGNAVTTSVITWLINNMFSGSDEKRS